MDDGLSWDWDHRNEDIQIQKPKVGSDALPIPDQENPTQRQNLKNSVSADDHALLQAHGDAPQEQIKEHNEMDLHVENRWEIVLLSRDQEL